jgi:hypothetical protein
MSALSCFLVKPSATVRTMSPPFGGFIASIAARKRCLSPSDPMRRDTPM